MTFATQHPLAGGTPAPLTLRSVTTEQNVAAATTRRSSSFLL